MSESFKNVFFFFLIILVACQSQQPLVTSRIPPTKTQNPAYETDEELILKAEQLEKRLLEEPQSNDLRIQLAGIYQELELNDKALHHLEILKNIGYQEEPRLYGSLGQIYKSKGQYELALDSYRQFRSLVNQEGTTGQKIQSEIDHLNFIIETLSQKYELKLESLGTAVNTRNHEYLPQMTMDKETIIFTRRFFNQEDLFQAKNISGAYEVTPLEEINTLSNEGGHTISADGQLLILTQCQEKKGFGNCDLYRSTKTAEGKWTTPVNMGSRINSRSWDAQPSLSSDGRTLFFSSRREGGFGGSDIWYSNKRSDGQWTVPKNLGGVINGKSDDESPFFHPDGRSLYFRSKSHKGLGSFDIYKSTKRDSGWTMPQHLGSPINSTGNDGALVVDLSGTTGYFATDIINGVRQEHLDIVKFTLPFEFRPSPMTYIKGRVTDHQTNYPVQAQIRIASLENTSYRSLYRTDVNGEFFAAIPVGEPILVNVSSDGYLFYSKHINISETFYGVNPDTVLIDLQKLILEPTSTVSSEETIVLNNLFFGTGSSELLPASNSEILILTGLLLDNPDIRIEIIGHTDNVGDVDTNLRLSQDRAIAVKNALIEKGINPQRIEATGKGENLPVASNDTPEGRAQNRRTEFRIIR